MAGVPFWLSGAFEMFGRKKFAIRRGSAFGKTRAWRKRAAPLCGARFWRASILCGQDIKNDHTNRCGHFFMDTGGDFPRLGQMNSPRAKVLPSAKMPLRCRDAAPLCGAQFWRASMVYGQDRSRETGAFCLRSQFFVRINCKIKMRSENDAENKGLHGRKRQVRSSQRKSAGQMRQNNTLTMHPGMVY